MSRVLLIDDMKSSRALLRVYLMNRGFEFEEADDGEAGLACARKVLPDLIVVDFHIPGMNGYEFIQRLRQVPALAQTPVILLTSDMEQVAKLKDRALPSTALATKPIDVAAFRSLVEQALGAVKAAS